MDYQNADEKIKYLKENIAPDRDRAHGVVCRAAARLTDGTFLPCVRFLNPGGAIAGAVERFARARGGECIVNNSPELGFRLQVKSIVADGNRVNEYDVARIEPSRFAFPPAILDRIEGETTMGWTGFSARMRDGKYFGFGTTGSFEFFEMPDGYEPADIAEILNHSFVAAGGEVQDLPRAFLYAPPGYREAVIHQSRPFFSCFVDEL
jgi:hypothetical protein